MLKFTTKHFPSSSRVKDDSGLPWSCLVAPYSLTYDGKNHVNFDKDLIQKDFARCGTCGSYVNPFCKFEKEKWLCGVCRRWSNLSPRYHGLRQRAFVPEIRYNGVDCLVSDPVTHYVDTGPLCCHLALLDLNGVQVEELKEGVRALVQSLPSHASFGFIAVGRTRVYFADFSLPTPHLQSINLKEKLEAGPAEFSLHSGVDLPVATGVEELFFPSHVAKAYVDATLDVALVAVLTQERAAPPPSQTAHPLLLAAALDSVAKLFTVCREDVASARVTVFSSSSSEISEDLTPAPAPALATPPDTVALDLAPNSPPTENVFALHDEAMWGLLSPPTALTTPTVPQSPEHSPIWPSYSALATAFVRARIGLDFMAIQPSANLILAFRPLVLSTGGFWRTYTEFAPGESGLPQDIFHMYTAIPTVYDTTVTVRSNPHFRINFADPFCLTLSDKHVVHRPLAHPNTHLLCDCTHTGTEGFVFDEQNYVLAQLVVEYTDISEAALDQTTSPRYTLTRRMRVYTVLAAVGSTSTAVYEAADSDTIAQVVLYKALTEVFEESVWAGWLLVRLWISRLLAAYARQPHTYDQQFSTTPALRILSRITLGLLKAPFFSPHTSTLTRLASAAFTDNLIRHVSPSLARRLAYPVIATYADPHHPTQTHCLASSTVLRTSASPIFVADRLLTAAVVAMNDTGPNSLRTELATHPDSPLAVLLHTIRSSRIIRPVVSFVNGLTNSADFSNALVEDESALGPPYGTFMSYLQKEVAKSELAQT